MQNLRTECSLTVADLVSTVLKNKVGFKISENNDYVSDRAQYTAKRCFVSRNYFRIRNPREELQGIISRESYKNLINNQPFSQHKRLITIQLWLYFYNNLPFPSNRGEPQQEIQHAAPNHLLYITSDAHDCRDTDLHTCGIVVGLAAPGLKLILAACVRMRHLSSKKCAGAYLALQCGRAYPYLNFMLDTRLPFDVMSHSIHGTCNHNTSARPVPLETKREIRR